MVAVLLDIDRLLDVFAELEMVHPHFSDTPMIAFLNSATGQILQPNSDAELDDCINSEHCLTFPKPKHDSKDQLSCVLDFTESIEDGVMRIQLDQVLKGRWKVRRFKDFLYTEEGQSLAPEWERFQRDRRYVELIDWLSEAEIDWEAMD